MGRNTLGMAMRLGTKLFLLTLLIGASAAAQERVTFKEGTNQIEVEIGHYADHIAFLGRVGQGCPRSGAARQPFSTLFTVRTMFGTFNPRFSDTVLPGPDAPNRSIPTLAPSSPT